MKRRDLRTRNVARRAIVPARLSGRYEAATASTLPQQDWSQHRMTDQRAMLVDYLKLMSWWLGRPPAPGLPPRLEQTLHGLLTGLSEKQIARSMGVSLHTAHGYVKMLHRRLGVASRSELLARFLPSKANAATLATP